MCVDEQTHPCGPRRLLRSAEVGTLALADCIVTVELAHNEDLSPPDGFDSIDERRYGAAKIVILKRTA